MPEYTPEDMPEITVGFEYDPPEYERGYQALPPDVGIEYILINGSAVSDTLEVHLIETYGDGWCREFVKEMENRRAA